MGIARAREELTAEERVLKKAIEAVDKAKFRKTERVTKGEIEAAVKKSSTTIKEKSRKTERETKEVEAEGSHKIALSNEKWRKEKVTKAERWEQDQKQVYEQTIKTESKAKKEEIKVKGQ